jgi:hypothetical protein
MKSLTTLLAAALLLATTTLAAADGKTYGKPMTLKEETPISAILAAPEKFKGKAVRVRGMVTNVCPERGCYLNLKGDKPFTQIMFKVDDGVIVFPAEALGSEAVAEGVVGIYSFSEQEQREMCPVEAKALNPKFDPAKIKGPLKVVRIDGLGAEIKK